MKAYPFLVVMMRMACLLWASLAHGLFAHGARADEASDLIAQAQGLPASVEHEASKVIDALTNKGLGESESAARLIREHFEKGTSISQKREQGVLENAPLIHEGKKKCQGQRTFSQGSGQCPSSLFESLEARQPPSASSGVKLLIFVSASVPADSLKELWGQANRTGGRLLFRGLIGGSFKETQSYIRALGIIADIDPVKFDELGISRVPTFVMSQGNTHDKMVGNITLSEFLEQSSINGDLKEEAAELYKKLQGGNL